MFLIVNPPAHPPGAPRVDRWPLRGGAPCLDFANTVAWRPNPQPVDALRTYDDLLVWSRHAGLLPVQQADHLKAQAEHDPAGAREALAGAVTLREAIYQCFTALATGRAWEMNDLDAISNSLVAGMTQSVLGPDQDGFAMHYREEERALDLPRWILAASAAHLLVSGDWRRVRECPGHDCGWLFLDKTKNGNRRWCDSADCGNRARVRAHARRRRERASEATSRG